MDARELARFLTIQFRYTTFVFHANLDGITEDEALRRPGAEGNCINWVAGHIVGTRGAIVKLAGGAAPFADDAYARYRRASAPIVAGEDGALTLARMRADMAATKEPLRAALAALDDHVLTAPAPFSPGDDPNETVGSLLVGLAFHEAYHTGQLGVLRRLAGSPGALR